jgi:predicted alpha/beta-fold hydrolase
VALGTLPILLGGCFSERSFTAPPDSALLVLRVDEPPRDARAWLLTAHQQCANLLPASDPPALTTDELVISDGHPLDVFQHYRRNFEQMESVFTNWHGLLHTANLSATHMHVHKVPEAWPGCQDTWIPVAGQDLELSARVCWARDARTGEPGNADGIILLPGLYGDNGVLRSRDLAVALNRHGFHVLAVEMRACGQTERRYPAIANGWGVFETRDLISIDDWLHAHDHVRRTGLIGFCWSANIAIVSAWLASQPDHQLGLDPQMLPYLAPYTARPRFTAGVLAFSPVLTFDALMDELEAPQSRLTKPVLHSMQGILINRQKSKGFQPANGNLRQLIEADAELYGNLPPCKVEQGLRLMRLLPHHAEPVADKLNNLAVPTLIVQAVNDPLVPAQAVADLTARTPNRNLAALVLPGGGHVGFAAYARAYYFSLILNFFDPEHGVAAGTS